MDSGGYVVVSVFVGRPRAGRDGIGIGCKEGGKDTYHDDGLLCEKCASLLHVRDLCQLIGSKQSRREEA